MPLRNRVDPFGELQETPARGHYMGNRGGRFHRADGTLADRRWVSRRWICCRLDVKGRRRKVWGDGYTELFFLDEVTAFAAGHRPCFECRRSDARRFAALWGEARALGRPGTVDEIDRTLDVERRVGRVKRRHSLCVDDLPDGVVVAIGGAAFALREGLILPWTASGYDDGTRPPAGWIDVLTPPSIIAVLSRGYAPRWHGTALRP